MEKFSNEIIRNLLGSWILDGNIKDLGYLAQGEDNIIYKIVTDRKVYVLRVAKDMIWGQFPRTEEDIQFEFSFQEYLNNQSIPLPRYYKTKKGDYVEKYVIDSITYYISLYDFVEGLGLEDLHDNVITLVAQFIGKLHCILKDYKTDLRRLRDFDVLSWVKTICYPRSDETFKKDEFTKFLKEKFDYSKVFILENIEQLEKYPLHCDINLSNLLVKNGTISALIDFDECHHEFIPLDLAFTIREVCVVSNSVKTRENLELFFVEYEKVNKLSELEKSLTLYGLLSLITQKAYKKYLADSKSETEYSKKVSAVLDYIKDHV